MARDKQRQDTLKALREASTGWYGLVGIALRAGHPQASVSARIRELRHKKYGGHNIVMKRDGKKCIYKLIEEGK